MVVGKEGGVLSDGRAWHEGFRVTMHREGGGRAGADCRVLW